MQPNQTSLFFFFQFLFFVWFDQKSEIKNGEKNDVKKQKELKIKLEKFIHTRKKKRKIFFFFFFLPLEFSV